MKRTYSAELRPPVENRREWTNLSHKETCQLIRRFVTNAYESLWLQVHLSNPAAPVLFLPTAKGDLTLQLDLPPETKRHTRSPYSAFKDPYMPH